MQWAARSIPHQRRAAGAAGEDELGADAVGGGDEESPFVDREQPGESAERADDGGRARRVDGATQTIDDRVRRGERYPEAA